jgi:hypothetical protein
MSENRPFEPLPEQTESNGSLPVAKSFAQATSRGLAVGIAVALVAMIGDLAILTDSTPLREGLVGSLCISWFLASAGLLVIWLGLGGWRLYIRLLIVGAAAAVAELAGDHGHLDVQGFGKAFVIVALAALPFGLIYLLGYELAPSTGLLGGEAAPCARQVSLKQLFAWSACAAIVACVARFVDITELFGCAIAAAILSLICVALVLASLSILPNGLVVFAVIVISVAAIISAVVADNLIADLRLIGDRDFLIATIALGPMTLISGVLLIYRAIGYRVRRRTAA